MLVPQRQPKSRIKKPHEQHKNHANHMVTSSTEYAQT